MKRTINGLILFVFSATCIAWINCGDDENPLVPSQLAGTYNLVTLTDKSGDVFSLYFRGFDLSGALPITFIAGERTTVTVQVGVPPSPAQLTFPKTSGSLVLTETRYTFTLIADKEAGPVTLITTTGTYSLSGSTLTDVGDDGETETFTISSNGNRLTLENDEIKFVVEKQ